MRRWDLSHLQWRPTYWFTALTDKHSVYNIGQDLFSPQRRIERKWGITSVFTGKIREGAARERRDEGPVMTAMPPWLWVWLCLWGAANVGQGGPQSRLTDEGQLTERKNLCS